jgi:hypothetical protein
MMRKSSKFTDGKEKLDTFSILVKIITGKDVFLSDTLLLSSDVLPRFKHCKADIIPRS